MGLSIYVGVLIEASRAVASSAEDEELGHERFARLNVQLRAAGVLPHHEPKRPWGARPWKCHMTYSALPRLRRVAAHLWDGRPLPEPCGEDSAWRDPVLQNYYAFLNTEPARRNASSLTNGSPGPRFDHLVNHSDCAGWYLPRPFDDVLHAGPPDDYASHLVGSSFQLRDECARLAQILELPPHLVLG